MTDLDEFVQQMADDAAADALLDQQDQQDREKVEATG